MVYRNNKAITQLNKDNVELCRQIEELKNRPSSQKMTAENKKLKEKIKALETEVKKLKETKTTKTGE